MMTVVNAGRGGAAQDVSRACASHTMAFVSYLRRLLLDGRGLLFDHA